MYEPEKIYVQNSGGMDAGVAALLQNASKGTMDPTALLAMMNNNGGMNGGWWWIWIILLFCCGGFGNGYGNNSGRLAQQLNNDANTNLLMQALQGNKDSISTLATTLNCDTNSLTNALNTINASVSQISCDTKLSGQEVINAITSGNATLASQLATTCCTTQNNITKMGYENQLAVQAQTNALQQNLNTVNSSVERGFSAIGYQMATDKCDIVRAGQDNTQRIIDTLNTHWQQDLQQRYNDVRLEMSQLKQNETLIAALKTTTTTTA